LQEKTNRVDAVVTSNLSVRELSQPMGIFVEVAMPHARSLCTLTNDGSAPAIKILSKISPCSNCQYGTTIGDARPQKRVAARTTVLM